MQLFMRNVPYAATELDIQLALVAIIHRPPFPTDPPTHFHVQLFRKKRSHAHSGIGILTFPTQDMRLLFDQTYGRQGVSVKGRTIFFSPNNRPLDEPLVQMLRSTPWQDPDVLHQQKLQMAQDSEPIPLRGFSFGRLCRDGAFSAELTPSGEGKVACDLEKRQLRLTLKPSAQRDTSSADMFSGDSFNMNILRDRLTDGLSSGEMAVSYTPSQITAIANSTAKSAPFRIFIESDLPPMFEKSGPDIMSIVNNTSAPPPERLSSLGGDRDMASACLVVCLDFDTDRDLATFKERARALHLPRVLERRIPVVERRLYSSENLASLDEFFVSLEFGLAFQVEKALFNCLLDPVELLSLRNPIAALRDRFGYQAAEFFQNFASTLDVPRISPRGWSQRRWGRRRRASEEAALAQQLETTVQTYLVELSRANRLLSGTPAFVQSYHLIITPTSRILEGPLPDQSNSVLQRFKHHECFLRVSFQEETRSRLRSDPAFAIGQLLKTRYRDVLVRGMEIAGRRFEFLGYSMSGLREGSVWFMTPFTAEDGSRLNAEGLRGKLGNFSHLTYKPARLGARWAQAFSGSDSTVDLEESQIERIPDICSNSGSVFTDGCSTISPELSDTVWKMLCKSQRKSSKRRRSTPSGFQIRLGGVKGVVVQDPRRQGMNLSIRPSQTKFEAPELRTLHIALTSSRPSPMFLNRPLIQLMDHLGSDESRIFQLQKTAIDDVQAIRSSYIAASQLFSDHGLGSSFRLPSLFKNLVKELELDAINTSSAQRLHHDLLDTCLTYACTHVLREIKYRAHIPVPGSYTLIGVADEWDCLEEGEIFASVYDDRTDMDLPITGRVLITRSPQIHPGDLQMVTAVRRPELEHLKNVVVFSCRGERSLPSCLGGGDLDGDPYNLILDPKLFPMRTSEPGSYISRPDKQTSEPCTVVDVADFVIDYINSDLVGYISILHLRFADLKGADCDECIRLAEAASWAVDFPKTGSPVEFSKLPRASGREKPDFLSYEGSNVGAGTNYYLSPKLLGRLFRNVPDMEDIVSDEQNQFPSTDGDVVYGALRRIDLEQIGLPSLLDPDDNLLQEMRSLLDEYSEQLFKIARAHTVSKHSGAFLTEAELVSGTIQAKWADHRKRKEAVTAMNLQTHELAKAIRKELRRTVSMALEDDQPDDDDDDEEDEEDDKAAQESEAFMRAWAAWTVAEEALVETPDAFGPPSFGLIALGALLETVKVMSDNAYSAY